MKEPIEAATQRGVGEAALVRRMCEIILGNTFGNEELDSLALLVGHHPDVLNAFHVPTEEVAELVAWLRDAAFDLNGSDPAKSMLTRAADLLEHHPAPVPVALSERPWEREGWCDEQGQCWMGDPGGGGFIPSWRLCRPEDAPRMRVSLPFHALPLPSGEVE